MRDGGTIVMAAECVDGIPGNGAFAEVLAGARSADDLINARHGAELDRWQAQVMGRVLRRAEVWLRRGGVADEMARCALLHPVADLTMAVAAAVRQRGAGARVAVLPEGPLTVATVATVTPPP